MIFGVGLSKRFSGEYSNRRDWVDCNDIDSRSSVGTCDYRRLDRRGGLVCPSIGWGGGLLCALGRRVGILAWGGSVVLGPMGQSERIPCLHRQTRRLAPLVVCFA